MPAVRRFPRSRTELSVSSEFPLSGFSSQEMSRKVPRSHPHTTSMHIPRGTSLTWRISDPHHPTQGEGVSPQVECTHVVWLYRLRRALGIIVVESSPALMDLH